MGSSRAGTGRTPGTAPRRRTARTVVGVGLSAALAAALLAGCGGSGAGGGTSNARSASRGEAAAPGAANGVAVPAAGDKAASGDHAARQAGSADPAALTGRRQIRTADLSVEVPDVSAAASKVRALAGAAKGFVAQEQTSTGPTPSPTVTPLEGRGTSSAAGPPPASGESILTLRVPETGLDALMDRVAAVGSLRSRSQASQDVSDQYVDAESRVRSQRASVARVRALLDKATDLDQVVQIESELSRRQSDLESLEAQLAALQDSTTLATLTVRLTPPGATPAVVDAGGFLAGLRGGWDALTASLAVALTIVGAVLPFAVLLALVGGPVLLVLRRRRSRPAAATP